jgi:protein-L-isoaspartate O-methyltransferase
LCLCCASGTVARSTSGDDRTTHLIDDIQQGHQVLKIGTRTGTGYTAALLAHRLGAENVVSIEIDPEIA